MENQKDKAREILLSIIKRKSDYKKAKTEYEKISKSILNLVDTIQKIMY